MKLSLVEKLALLIANSAGNSEYSEESREEIRSGNSVEDMTNSTLEYTVGQRQRLVLSESNGELNGSFLQHKSHRSHASHRSHYSHRSSPSPRA